MSIGQIVSEQSLWIVLKIGFLLAYILYGLFSLVLMAQVKQMTKTIDAGMNGKLIMIARIHLILAVSLFVLALIVL